MVGTMARAVQEAIDTGEAISGGAVNLVQNTLRQQRGKPKRQSAESELHRRR
jgi:hypothetical protein